MKRIYFVSFCTFLSGGAPVYGHARLNMDGLMSKHMNEAGEFCSNLVGRPTKEKVATIINYKLVGVKIFGFELVWG